MLSDYKNYNYTHHILQVLLLFVYSYNQCLMVKGERRDCVRLTDSYFTVRMNKIAKSIISNYMTIMLNENSRKRIAIENLNINMSAVRKPQSNRESNKGYTVLL